MAALGSLVVSLEANTAKFTSDMGKAAYQTEQAMKQMAQDAKIVGAAMGALGVAGAGALAIMVKQSIDAADNLRDMSQKTGIAVETLNGLGFAAGQAGGNLESMVSAAGKLNKSIAEAASGTPAQANAFKALGINVLDASGKLKTADVVMAEMADKFSTYADGPEKVALSLALMGKSGADMIPTLNDGGDAMRENIAYAQKYSAMTTELADQSDNFNDTMGKLAVQQTGFANTMTAAVLPILQAVADETLRAAEESNAFSGAASGVQVVLQALVVVGSTVAFTFKGIGTEILGISTQLVALAHGDFKTFSFIGDSMKEDAARARVEHDKFIDHIMNPVAATVTPNGTPTPKGRAPRLASDDAGKALKKAADEAAKALEFYNELMDKASGYSKSYAEDQNKLARVLKSGKIGYEEYAAAVQKYVESQPGAVANRKANQDAFDDMLKTIEANEKVRQSWENSQAAAQQYLDTVSKQASRQVAGIGKGAAYRDNQSGLNSIEDKLSAKRSSLSSDQRDGKLSQSTYEKELALAQSVYEQEVGIYKKSRDDIKAAQADWTNGFSEAMANYQSEAENVADSTSAMFTNAFKGMENALVSFVTTGKLDFASLANSIIADMVRIAIQQSITAPMMAGMTSMFGFADGGVVNSPSLSAYSGGVFNSPQLFKFASGAGVFGEAGPEAIMPLTRGPNGKLGVQATGGGSRMVVNIHPPSGFEAKTEQRSDASGVDVLEVMFTKIDQKMAAGIAQGNSKTAGALGQTYGLNRVAGAY